MTLEQILKFLDGKKAIITGVILTTVGYLVSVGVIDKELANYINTIITIVFGVAEYKTPGVLGARRK